MSEVAGGYSMAFSLLSIGPVIFGSVEDLIAYMQNKQHLATNRTCPSCGSTSAGQTLKTSTGI